MAKRAPIPLLGLGQELRQNGGAPTPPRAAMVVITLRDEDGGDVNVRVESFPIFQEGKETPAQKLAATMLNELDIAGKADAPPPPA